MRISVLLVILPASLAAYGGFIYYRLLWLRLQGNRALQHVELELSGHHQTIPELMGAVSRYLKHETWIIEHVFEARLKLIAAKTLEERMVASTHLSQALNHLFQIAQGCVEFHGDDEASLVHMQVELAEQKIALARDYYNHVVEHYNAYLSRFPNNILGQIAGFKRRELFAFPAVSSIAYANLELK